MAEPGLDPVLQGLTVAVLAGTGPQGRGLARRFAGGGLPVLVGSRNVERAETVVGGLRASLAAHGTSEVLLRGVSNRTAATEGDLVVVAVPWDGHRDLLEEHADALAGRVVVDCVNPLGFDEHGVHALRVAEGSAAQQAAAVLPGSTVVAAFHHVSAALLEDPAVPRIDLDVLVLGDDRSATDLVQALAAVIPGVRGVFGGRLRNAGQVEALTANLISVNRRYKARAGLRFTDV